MREIDGRVIVVTGASGNLGAATATLLAGRGARLVLLDRAEGRALGALEEGLRAGRHRAEVADVTDERSVEDALARGSKELGPVQGLVCTVGGYLGGKPVIDCPWAEWERMLAMNLRATVACTRAVLSGMLARGAGSIVHVASLAAISAGPGEAAYAAAKSAVLSFTQSVAAETKERGVRVNAVLPGTMDTPQNRAWMSEGDRAKAVDPDAVADVIAFLLSDAARAVTGASVRVTGRQ